MQSVGFVVDMPSQGVCAGEFAACILVHPPRHFIPVVQGTGVVRVGPLTVLEMVNFPVLMAAAG